MSEVTPDQYSNVIAQWLRRLAEAGFPAGSDEVYDLASKICADKYGLEFDLGKNWVRWWSEQFLPLIKIQATTSLTASIDRLSTLLQFNIGFK